MPLIQTEIGFSERKRRTPSSKQKALIREKENSHCDSPLKTPRKVSAAATERCSSTLLKERNRRNITGNKREQASCLSDDSDAENTSSPPKRDKLSTEKNFTYSPSQHLDQLNINSPSAHSSSKSTRENHLGPKKLFGREISYRQARQALHSTAPTQLPAREEQLENLNKFLSNSLESRSSATLYISGPPGTGKTACLTKIMQDSEFRHEFKKVYINCTSMKSSNSVYSRISEELGLKVSGKTEKQYIASIEKYFAANARMILLVLDEMDQLDSKRQAVLYTIFEWPSKYSSNLVLIGIANALDLTDRILPRLQARIDLKPNLMHFAPYTKQEIVHILSERLKELDVTEVFSPVAIQLLAGKVASVSGDVRRALDIGRRVLELAEAQRCDAPLPLQPSLVTSATDPQKPSLSVDLKVVMDVLNSVYGTSQSLSAGDGNDSNDTFPLQQKVTLCTLLLLMKKGCTKDVTLGKLHDVYRRVCVKRNLLALDQAEFLNVCQLVQTRGAIRVESKKEARMAKISLQWDEQEVDSALKDKQLLASIVNDSSCLSR